MRTALFLVLLAIVALAPLPLGSNRDWSWSPLAAIIGLALVARGASAVWSQQRTFSSFRALAAPAILVGAIAIWVVVQASSWTPLDWTNPIRTATASLFPLDGARMVALEREQVWTSVMRLLVYVGVFLLAADLCDDGARARTLMGTVVWSAVVYTFVAMAAAAANRLSASTGLTLYTPNPGYFTGPFVNRNNYATYAVMAAVAALGMAIGAIAGGRGTNSTRQRWRRRLAGLTGWGGLFLAAATVLATGVVLSGSRAGLAALMIGVVITTALFAQRARWALTGGAALTVIALVLLMPGGASVLGRMVMLAGQGDGDRMHLFAMTWGAVSLRPFLGWGAGSFPTLYSVFQPLELSLYFDKAHNTYLELAFDYGIVGAALLVAAIGWVAFRCLRGVVERHQDRELAIIGVATTIAVGAHAFFDFSLQIPGVAIVYAALLGAAWAQSWSSRRVPEEDA